MASETSVMPEERLNQYVREAAKAAGYEEGFGVEGCDLSLTCWWVAYARQSSKEQAENDRLGEYLLTCAKMAKREQVMVPREYVLYDSVTSEHLDRPQIKYLRNNLMRERHISGVLIPTQGRLSADTHHQLTFEKEARHYEVRLLYGDAPSGDDWGSQTTRLIQAQANALRVKTNRDNVLAGNIGRVLSGKVPAQRAPYGYVYKAEKAIEPRSGRAKVLKAWWEINQLAPDGQPLQGSRGWAITQIFSWIGDEGRTAHWVIHKLNELSVPPPSGSKWEPKMISVIVKRKCYTGKGEYNAYERVPNPGTPLGDLTLGVKRTLK
ncbi:MAG: recombinase family protein, partial [Dehalococcoidia bacterium]